ncbi:hypothetical protein [Bifidobacterium sp.]|uniref:hypothetical protein n=1 Tax=Bifidobacterium sp. TaxID=41200 RepID=UPI003869C985
MADVEVRIDAKALRRAASVAARPQIESATSRICGTANALGAPFRTGLYHRNHQSPAVGNTQPSYGADVETHGGVPVGIVHTGNYAAMRDNAQNNTLLKSIG